MVVGELKFHAEPKGAGAKWKNIIGKGDVGKPVPTVRKMADGSEKGEKIFFFLGEKLGDGAALGTNDGKIGLGGPEEAFEEALAVEELAGFDFEDPAGDAVDDFFAAGLGLVKPKAVFSQEEGLDFADIPKILGGEFEAD